LSSINDWSNDDIQLVTNPSPTLHQPFTSFSLFFPCFISHFTIILLFLLKKVKGEGLSTKFHFLWPKVKKKKELGEMMLFPPKT